MDDIRSNIGTHAALIIAHLRTASRLPLTRGEIVRNIKIPAIIVALACNGSATFMIVGKLARYAIFEKAF